MQAEKHKKFQAARTVLTSGIILATRNRLENVLTFLDSVPSQSALPDELIVIDSSDNKLINESRFTQIFCAQQFPHTQLIYKHTKPGLTHQRNVGVSLASTDIVHFLDDDTVLDNTYLERMNEIFATYPEYAGGMGSVKGVGPKRFHFHRFLRHLFLLQRDYANGTFTASGMPTHAYGTKTFKTVQVLGGCCMSYRLSVFKKHLFDEKLSRYSYMEDCDFSRRVSYEYPLFFNPDAQLEHHHSPLARDRVQDNRAMYIHNYSYLFFKNFYPRNKLKVFAYAWTIIGLFVQAIALRDKAYLKGYVKGLREYYF
jgi:GT2 family glycosyltransferase